MGMIHTFEWEPWCRFGLVERRASKCLREALLWLMLLHANTNTIRVSVLEADSLLILCGILNGKCKKNRKRNEASLSYLPMHTAHVLSRPATLDRRIPMTILLCDALDGILSLNWCGFVDVEECLLILALINRCTFIRRILRGLSTHSRTDRHSLHGMSIIISVR